MNQIIIDSKDQHLQKWVANILEIKQGFSPGQALGVMRHDKLIAAVVYHDFRGNQIEASIASISKFWATKPILRALFSYPFIQLKVNRMLVLCAEDNAKAMKMNKQLGFTKEGRLRGLFDKSDGILWGMLKNERKFI